MDEFKLEPKYLSALATKIRLIGAEAITPAIVKSAARRLGTPAGNPFHLEFPDAADSAGPVERAMSLHLNIVDYLRFMDTLPNDKRKDYYDLEKAMMKLAQTCMELFPPPTARLEGYNFGAPGNSAVVVPPASYEDYYFNAQAVSSWEDTQIIISTEVSRDEE